MGIGRLVGKELKESKTSLAFLLAVCLGFQMLILRVHDPRQKALAFLLLLIPLGFLHVWIVWSAYQSYRREWNSDTTYLCLVLPVSGWTLALSKILAPLLELAAVILLIVGTALLFMGKGYKEILAVSSLPSDFFIRIGLLGLVGALFFGFILMVLVQFSYVFGRFVPKFQGLVSFWTMLLLSWTLFRIGLIVARVFSFLPALRIAHSGTAPLRAIVLDLAPFFGVGVVALFLFFALGYFLEHDVEV